MRAIRVAAGMAMVATLFLLVFGLPLALLYGVTWALDRYVPDVLTLLTVALLLAGVVWLASGLIQAGRAVSDNGRTWPWSRS